MREARLRFLRKTLRLVQGMRAARLRLHRSSEGMRAERLSQKRRQPHRPQVRSQQEPQLLALTHRVKDHSAQQSKVAKLATHLYLTREVEPIGSLQRKTEPQPQEQQWPPKTL